MKRKILLLVLILQSSLYGFSQSDIFQQYTEQEIIKLTAYVNDLERKNLPAHLTDAEAEEQKQVADLLAKPSHGFTEGELIKITNYIKKLETTAQPDDSMHVYTDVEVNKFVNYIADLEKRISTNNPASESHPEKQNVTALLNSPTHKYTDFEVIKLANYIKDLERADSIAIVFAKTQSDSLALVKVNPKDSAQLVNTEIEKYGRLVFFNFNSASLKEESYKPLNEVVEILKENKNLAFVIEGHTDNVGTSEYNMSLSKKRAATVKKYLISKGIPSAKVTSKGLGEDVPVDTNDTEEGRAKNRRVEIKGKK